jgi:hypothetical protein
MSHWIRCLLRTLSIGIPVAIAAALRCREAVAVVAPA